MIYSSHNWSFTYFSHFLWGVVAHSRALKWQKKIKQEGSFEPWFLLRSKTNAEKAQSAKQVGPEDIFQNFIILN